MNSPVTRRTNDNAPTIDLNLTAFNGNQDKAEELFGGHAAASARPRRSILYSNAEDSAFIVDIPESITRAQSLRNQQVPSLRLLSCPSPVIPYPSTEPKSGKARAKLLDRLAHSIEHVELHDEYSRLIIDALKLIEEHDVIEPDGPLSFCLPRAIEVEAKAQASNDATMKRKTEGKPVQYHDADPALGKLKLLQNHSKSKFKDPQTGTILPPLSSVLLGLVDTSIFALSTFHTACLAHPTATDGRFSLVVLDPPWPNKSVARSSSYATSPTLIDLIETLQGLGLEEHIADRGFVACWVTTKATIRDAIIGDGGLFEAWGVDLVEEWIWCKVTTKGEPVTNVDGLWRKPYEVCLIGRRIGNADKQLVVVKRRVILGVPDLHSRKPCLKELAQKLLFDNNDGQKSYCTALELYARYAVAGWMSWGLEATKYNHENWWMEEAASSGADCTIGS